MLFNSYIFIFVFLPSTLAGFYLIGTRGHHRVAISWLVAASLFFYGWWNPAYLGLILGSILFNYAVGLVLSNSAATKNKAILVLGITANLALIGYFKYSNFFVENINSALNLGFNMTNIILPLAISFFTFQQIAYLVDAYRGETREYNFLHYCLFVTFFPQLIAGPIVHHRDMLPQFAKDIIYKLNYKHLAVGLTIFTIGLFKKVVIADNLAPFATPVFSAAEQQVALSFFEAWGGALAYTFQLYFDFSGYSDMAIGLARMFGILLPQNFSSPYKARNIVDFWRRWHITLSTFLKDYLYIPLGGNQCGKSRRYVNLLITMLLGGLWHGAAWTFVVWGALHGVYLIINHGWHHLCRTLGFDSIKPSLFGSIIARSTTFLAVVIAWVVFRADSLQGAKSILWAMSGANGISLPERISRYAQHNDLFAYLGIHFKGSFYNHLVDWDDFTGIFLCSILVSWLLPNTQQFMREHRPTLEVNHRDPLPRYSQRLIWRNSPVFALLVTLLLVTSIILAQGDSEFLYFRF